jgi:hypothetical protein
MAMSPRADHIIIRPTMHLVGLLDVMSVLLAGATSLTGRVTRRAS